MRRTVAFLYAFHLLVAADGIAVVAAAVTIGLFLQPSARAETARDAPATRSLRALLRERHGASVLALMFFVGGLGGVVNLLVPLRLHREGLSAGAIGVAFTAATALFVLTSVQISRFGNRVPLL